MNNNRRTLSRWLLPLAMSLSLSACLDSPEPPIPNDILRQGHILAGQVPDDAVVITNSELQTVPLDGGGVQRIETVRFGTGASDYLTIQQLSVTGGANGSHEILYLHTPSTNIELALTSLRDTSWSCIFRNPEGEIVLQTAYNESSGYTCNSHKSYDGVIVSFLPSPFLPDQYIGPSTTWSSKNGYFYNEQSILHAYPNGTNYELVRKWPLRQAFPDQHFVGIRVQDEYGYRYGWLELGPEPQREFIRLVLEN